MESKLNIPIPDFFAQKSVFLTGVTGFVGKAILEKLLRGCPEVRKIYVLVRGHRDKTGEERLRDVLEAPLFQRVRDSNPDCLKKVLPVNGDVSFNELGISSGDAAEMRENVSVVIHSAANTSFAAQLKVLLKVNVEGTKNMLEFAKQIQNLKAFVYVSTAFSNSDRLEIEEKVYPVNIDPLLAIRLCSDLPSDIMETFAPHLKGKHKLYYTYSKQLAEALVGQAQLKLPVCIVRPSIITPAHQEPFPGWIDNFIGFNGAMVGMARGVVRVGYMNKHVTPDIIPIDHVVNLTIAAAAYLGSGLRDEKTKGVTVYSCTSTENPFCVDTFKASIMKAIEETPFDKVYWYPSVEFVSSWLLREIMDFLFHYVPAVIADAALTAIGKKPKHSVVKIYKKLKKFFEASCEVIGGHYLFSTGNKLDLYEQLLPEDQKCFNFDMSTLNHDDYIRTGFYGFRRYGAGEKDEDLPKARRNFQRLKVYYFLSWMLMILVGAIFIGVFIY